VVWLLHLRDGQPHRCLETHRHFTASLKVGQDLATQSGDVPAALTRELVASTSRESPNVSAFATFMLKTVKGRDSGLESAPCCCCCSQNLASSPGIVDPDVKCVNNDVSVAYHRFLVGCQRSLHWGKVIGQDRRPGGTGGGLDPEAVQTRVETRHRDLLRLDETIRRMPQLR